MKNLKEKLLQTNLFFNNEYLDKYVELCNNPKNNKESIVEKHHILQVLAFNILKLPVDNSSDNLVELDIKNHVLAHYYLSLCSKNKYILFGNITCLNLMTHRDYSTLKEEWILNNLKELEKIRKIQRKLNSELQIGLASGEKNGNCKYSIAECNKIKDLLSLNKYTYKEIAELTNFPVYLIQSIKTGNHWSCKIDNFKIKKRIKPRINKSISKLEKEKNEWKQEIHFCKNCGCELTEFLPSSVGNGLFCSKHCVLSYVNKLKFNKNPNLAKEMLKNRKSYKGENNPNFGKKASKETKQKMSIARKNSLGVKNASRFKGHKHTEESKQKISESLKAKNK